jgi:hypothetical protein
MDVSRRRTTHPYHMYDAIQAQPALVAEVMPANTAPLARAAELFAPQHDLYLCGIGTSFGSVAKMARDLIQASAWCGPQITGDVLWIPSYLR